MNEWVWSIGGMILTGETEVLGEKHYTASVVDEWMSMERWWNDTDRGNWSTGRQTFVHHKSHLDRNAVQPEPTQLDAGD